MTNCTWKNPILPWTQSLQKEALPNLASNTQNIHVGLTWLQTAAKNTNDKIIEPLVKNVQEEASRQYIENQLERLSSTHSQLYQITVELVSETSGNTNTGSIYQQYQEQTQNPLSQTGESATTSNN